MTYSLRNFNRLQTWPKLSVALLKKSGFFSGLAIFYYCYLSYFVPKCMVLIIMVSICSVRNCLLVSCWKISGKKQSQLVNFAKMIIIIYVVSRCLILWIRSGKVCRITSHLTLKSIIWRHSLVICEHSRSSMKYLHLFHTSYFISLSTLLLPYYCHCRVLIVTLKKQERRGNWKKKEKIVSHLNLFKHLVQLRRWWRLVELELRAFLRQVHFS